MLLLFFFPFLFGQTLSGNAGSLSRETPITLEDEGVRLGQVTRLNCVGAGITCTRTGNATGNGILTVTGGGGSSDGGAPLDGEYVTYSSNASLTNERVLTAGTNVTLDTTTPGQIIVNASGGSGSGLTHQEVMTRVSYGF